MPSSRRTACLSPPQRLQLAPDPYPEMHMRGRGGPHPLAPERSFLPVAIA